MKVDVIRNQDIRRVLIGIPKGHKHLRICIELKNGINLVFQEATIANISRAYITLKTHPRIRAQELETKMANVEQLKEGYTKHQLLETSKTYEEIEEELGNLLEAPI
jgi:biotin-(acetyl-CoA carboxylase) ligase